MEPGEGVLWVLTMITLAELTKTATPDEAQLASLKTLLDKVNVVRAKWGKPLIVTSGLRSREQHDAIYRRMGKKAPGGSAHLSGEAVDFYDRDGLLGGFLLDNLGLLEELGLYMEDPTVTRGWIHLQTRRPGSGRRIFMP